MKKKLIYILDRYLIKRNEYRIIKSSSLQYVEETAMRLMQDESWRVHRVIEIEVPFWIRLYRPSTSPSLYTIFFPWQYNTEKNERKHKITGQIQRLVLNDQAKSSWDASTVWRDI